MVLTPENKAVIRRTSILPFHLLNLISCNLIRILGEGAEPTEERRKSTRKKVAVHIGDNTIQEGIQLFLAISIVAKDRGIVDLIELLAG